MRPPMLEGHPNLTKEHTMSIVIDTPPAKMAEFHSPFVMRRSDGAVRCVAGEPGEDLTDAVWLDQWFK